MKFVWHLFARIDTVVIYIDTFRANVNFEPLTHIYSPSLKKCTYVVHQVSFQNYIST